MIQIKFSKEEKKQLDYERFNHPHPVVQRRMEVLWLKSNQLKHRNVAKLANVSSTTVTNYLKTYKKNGIDGLKEVNFYKPKSQLVEFSMSIKNYFAKNPPASIKEAMGKIFHLTGIKRSETQVANFVKSIGLKYRKIGMVPAKADPEKQELFVKKTWNLN